MAIERKIRYSGVLDPKVKMAGKVQEERARKRRRLCVFLIACTIVLLCGVANAEGPIAKDGQIIFWSEDVRVISGEDVVVPIRAAIGQNAYEQLRSAGFTAFFNQDAMVLESIQGVDCTAAASNAFQNTGEGRISLYGVKGTAGIDLAFRNVTKISAVQLSYINRVVSAIEAGSGSTVILQADPYVEDGKMLILRGQWANESTYTLQAKVNGAVATTDGTQVKWSVQGNDAHGFVNPCVSVDENTGELTVLQSGVASVHCVSTVDSSKSFDVTVIVPGDYDRDGYITPGDVDFVNAVFLSDSGLNAQNYSLQLSDINEDGIVLPDDVEIINGLFLCDFII